MSAGKFLNLKQADLDKYTTTTYYLSRGASGNVYGPIPWQGSQLALKQVMFPAGKVTDEFKTDIEAKKRIWDSLEHKNLLRIHQVEITRLPKVMFLVMDFAAGGSLHVTLRSLGTANKLQIAVVTDWTKQITDGMLYLHQKDIVHRDLKSSNILLTEPFDVRKKLTLKIADFDEIKEYDHTATMSFVGTFVYMAPEVLKDQRFSKFSDVWSFGVVIWEMLSGDIPHKGIDPNKIMPQSIEGKLDNLPIEPSFPGEFKLLLNKCWESTHTERISFHDISGVLQRIDENSNSSTEEFPSLRKEHHGEQQYRSDLVLVKKIITKATRDKKKDIRGFTILDNELFVVSNMNSYVEVYDSIKFSFSRQRHLTDIANPQDIVSCIRNKCLYISDYRRFGGTLNAILRVDPDANVINKWSTGDDYGRLSVTVESTVIFISSKQNILNEFSPDGQTIRVINLSSTAGINYPWHAIKLTNGHFVVSHGGFDNPRRPTVSNVDGDGKHTKSFCGNCGSECQVYLSVDANRFVIFTDHENKRVLLLNPDLEFNREILSREEHGLIQPKRILLDESNGRLFVTDNAGSYNNRILVFKFK